MVKVIKKIAKVFLYLLVVAPLLPIALWAVMLIPSIQNSILNRTVNWFKNETGCSISFTHAGITGVSKIGFEDLLILHPNGDTIVYSQEAAFSAAALYQFMFKDDANLAAIRKLQFDNSVFNLAIDSVRDLNIQFFISYLESKIDTTDTTPPSGKPFRIKSIQITNSVFTLKDVDRSPRDYGIDFTDLRCENMNIDVRNLTIIRDTVRMEIRKVSLKEKSGFALENFTSLFELCKTHLFFSEVEITTPYSQVNTHKVHMSFSKFKDYKIKTLYKKINFGFAFYDTKLNLKDLGYFVPFFKETDQIVNFAGNFSGPLTKFKCDDFIVGWGESSLIKGKFKMDGLPRIRETFFIADFDEISTCYSELTSLKLPHNYLLVLPQTMEEISSLQYNGNFTGFINDFVSKGLFTTNLGDLFADVTIIPDSIKGVSFNGTLKSNNLDLGSLVGTDDIIGKVTGTASVKGFYLSKDKIDASIKGHFSDFGLVEYNYRDININGSFKNKKIDGKISVNDPNLAMEAETHLDFNGNIPSYKITTNVIDANLYGLKIIESDSTFHASFLAETDINGKSIDELNGDIRLLNSLFTKSDRQIQIYDLNMNIVNKEDYNKILLYSDIIDADLSGRYKLSHLKDNFLHYLSCYIPNLTKKDCITKSGESPVKLDIYTKLKRTHDFFDFFFPDYYLAENTVIKGSYQSQNEKPLRFDIYTPQFRHESIVINGLVANIWSDTSKVFADVGSQEINLNNRIRFENFTLSSQTGNNKLSFTTRWHNWDTAIYKGKLSGDLFFGLSDSISTYHVALNPSEVTIHDSLWNLSSSNIYFENGTVRLDSLSFRNKDEILLAYGYLSNSSKDSLYFDFINFNLAYINFFTKRQGVEFIGKLNGTGYLIGAKNPLFFTELAVDNLKVNGEELGYCLLNSKWDNEKQSLNINANAQRENVTVLKLSGDYFPQRGGKMDFQMKLNKLRTDIFNPFLPGVFSDITGNMTGHMELTGSTDRPSLSGKIKFSDNAFTIDYLKTRYHFATDLEIAANNFILNKIEVFDQHGNTAIVNGILRTEYLRKLDLNLNINAKNLLCLNTVSSDNDLFYGTAFATGTCKIKGRPSDLHFDVDASTGKDTRFFIPLSGQNEVSDFNYITYVRNDTTDEVSTNIEKQIQMDLTGIRMDFKLHVTPQAEVQIIFDSKMGDIIKSRGVGDIQMSINTMGTFEMMGEYVIQQGDYLFTLQNVINKKLEIQPGSALRWAGDPLNAQVDITALYRKKVSLTPLFPLEEEMRGNATVDCQVFLSDGLLKPTVKYDIDLPYAQEDVKEKVRAKITTDEELTKQILSILIMGQFYVAEGGEGEYSGKYAPGVNASELLSNQLSNWLSQISNDFDLGVNYRPETDMSSSEIEFALSTQLFNDRLSLNGSFDMRSNATQSKAKNVVEVDLDYKLNKSGNLRARAYNRPNDDQGQDLTGNTTYYTTGLGIFYTEEFSSFGELMNKYWSILTGRKKKQAPDEADIDSNN